MFFYLQQRPGNYCYICQIIYPNIVAWLAKWINQVNLFRFSICIGFIARLLYALLMIAYYYWWSSLPFFLLLHFMDSLQKWMVSLQLFHNMWKIKMWSSRKKPMVKLWVIWWAMSTNSWLTLKCFTTEKSNLLWQKLLHHST